MEWEAPDVKKGEIEFFRLQLLTWFKYSGRHHLPWRSKTLKNYEIVISEILLQRTKAETVAKFFESFINALSSWEAIDKADFASVEKLLKPMGLHRQRAQRLKALAHTMVELVGVFPTEVELLKKIPFLGQYIINAIKLQVWGIPSPLLDVNMARVLERYFGERRLSDIRYDPYLQQLANDVVNHRESININWAILDFAALVCRARNPLCRNCMLSVNCVFFQRTIN